MKLQLHWQIIICMLLGTITGVYFNSIDYTTSNLYALIILLGDIFIRLLKMVIVPKLLENQIPSIGSILLPSNFFLACSTL